MWVRHGVALSGGHRRGLSGMGGLGWAMSGAPGRVCVCGRPWSERMGRSWACIVCSGGPVRASGCERGCGRCGEVPSSPRVAPGCRGGPRQLGEPFPSLCFSSCLSESPSDLSAPPDSVPQPSPSPGTQVMYRMLWPPGLCGDTDSRQPGAGGAGCPGQAPSSLVLSGAPQPPTRCRSRT